MRMKLSDAAQKGPDPFLKLILRRKERKPERLKLNFHAANFK